MYTNRGVVHVPGTTLPLTPLFSPTVKARPNQVTLSLVVGAVVASLGNSTASHSGLSHMLSHLGCRALLGCDAGFFFVGCGMSFLMVCGVVLILDFSESRVVGVVNTVLLSPL